MQPSVPYAITLQVRVKTQIKILPMGDGGDEWSNEEYLVQAIIMADDKCIVIVVDLEGPRIIIQGADLGGRWCLKTLEHF